MTKKWASVFPGKNGVTPIVATPGDTNPSNATVRRRKKRIEYTASPITTRYN